MLICYHTQKVFGDTESIEKFIKIQFKNEKEREMKKRTSSILMVCMVLSSLFVVMGNGIAAKPIVQPGEKASVIIGFKEKPESDLILRYEGDIKCTYTFIPAISANLSREAIEAIVKDERIAYIEPDYEVHVLEETLPWGVDRIDAEKVHPYNKGRGVKVAIIDTGIDYTHPDIDGNYKGGYDFVNNDDDPMDDHGHGTHCAGIVAAEDNDIGVIGVAPEAYLYGVKVLNSGGSGYVSDVIAGIQWSIANGMQVISMSLGSDSDSTSLHNACNAAYNAGVVLVAAAGNDGNRWGSGDNVDYPARYDSVIAVAATDSNDNRASWSSTGPAVELSAPGVNIYSTYRGGYTTLSGTSMACPHVTGTAALVWYAYPNYTNTQVRQRLQGTAEDLGTTGRDTWYGYGLVDAEQAAYTPTPDTTPPASITNLQNVTGQTWINWMWTNPPDADFNYTMVYLDGTWQTNTSDPFYNATGITPDTYYEIGTHTVDKIGNINTTWVNQTTKTSALLLILNITNAQTDKSTYNLNENVTVSCIVQNETGYNITAEGVNAEILKPDSSIEWVAMMEGLVGHYNGAFTNTSLDGTYNVTIYANKTGYVNDTAKLWFSVSPWIEVLFDTWEGTYPSIFGTHNGTIIPSHNVTVSKIYTYPCAGTGGHTEYAKIWNSSWNDGAEAHWNGYTGDWYNISFNHSFTLLAGEIYNYTIITGSYPQIIHEPSFNTIGGTITCTEFRDANGKEYDNWIPAIRLLQ
jgi:subtilisin